MILILVQGHTDDLHSIYNYRYILGTLEVTALKFRMLVPIFWSKRNYLCDHFGSWQGVKVTGRSEIQNSNVKYLTDYASQSHQTCSRSRP